MNTDLQWYRVQGWVSNRFNTVYLTIHMDVLLISMYRTVAGHRGINSRIESNTFNVTFVVDVQKRHLHLKQPKIK